MPLITKDVPIRVRYNETDQMGIVHHSNYIFYYEVARTELMRSLGTSYREMEERGALLVVRDVRSRFVAPAYYDEILTVRVSIREMPTVKVTFDFEIFRGCLDFDTEGISGSGRGILSHDEGGVGIPTASEASEKSTDSESERPRMANSKQPLNPRGEVIHTGEVVLACVDKVTRRPKRAPEWFVALLVEASAGAGAVGGGTVTEQVQ